MKQLLLHQSMKKTAFESSLDKEHRANVSVVIATLNEEEGIGPTIEELQKDLDNPYLVIVDGNSVDRTIEIAKNMGADVLLQEGKGQGRRDVSRLPESKLKSTIHRFHRRRLHLPS